jgi:methanogenic corrinoid protein MtbC1
LRYRQAVELAERLNMSVCFDRIPEFNDTALETHCTRSHVRRHEDCSRAQIAVKIMKPNCIDPDGALQGVPDDEVARLAARAIAVLLSENGARRAAAEAQLLLLCDAFLSDGNELRHAVLSRMRENGTPAADIIDTIIPQVARFMGRRWANDEISFAEVTIGGARLQETVRALGRSPMRKTSGPSLTASQRPRILLVIPRCEDHTLGTFVAADQFRRQGVEVDTAIDLHPRDVGEMVRKSRYAMVGITAAGRRTLASAKELVDTIRASVRRVTPIVLGGSVVTGGLNLKQLTGVDHVVLDVQGAIRLCGLGTEMEVMTDVAS